MGSLFYLGGKTMDVMVVIERVGYDIRTSLENVNENVSDHRLIEMGKAKFKELGVEIKENDSFDLYAY
jgi:hypothetical protein